MNYLLKVLDMPERLEALNKWLQQECDLDSYDIESASGDASFRRYFRITMPGGETRIAMDAPPDREDSHPFVSVGRKLEAAGLHVPHIHAADLSRGFMLLEDLGNTLYLQVLDKESAEHLYGDALKALVTMQAGVDCTDIPPYDRELLGFELELFREWLCGTHLGLMLGEDENRMLDDTFEWLIENALSQPQTFVHRDYHSRNLMVTAPPTPGIIDFQDAVHGPVTYDLVSLLKDAYIRWPLEQVDRWVAGYCRLAVQSGLVRAEDERLFQRWFDLMGVQRHVKVAGIFARLFRRDGKEGYLNDIPLVLDYILEMVPRYAELEGLGALIRNRVQPALEAA